MELGSSLLLLLIASSAIGMGTVKDPRCEISIYYRKGDLMEPQPLLLTDDDEPRFLKPSAPQLVSISAGAKLLLACPGRGNSFKNLTIKQTLEIQCIGKKHFRLINGTSIMPFSSFSCQRLPSESVRKLSTGCLNGHQAYEIGFQVKQSFVPTIEICREDATYRTLYAKETIPKEIGNQQIGFPRRTWKYRGYFGSYAMNDLYKRTKQQRTFELLLGKSSADRYVTPREFLNRGHLAAHGDFIYGAQKSTSLWHLNSLPQWSSFNGGNWLILEESIRSFATRQQKDLVVYTGGHGVLALPDDSGELQDVYLFANGTMKAFPVPKFFWKVVQDPVSRKATAFVGLNNVHVREVSDDMYLCPDIGEQGQFSWLTSWKAKNMSRGLSYVCRVGDLRKSVPTVPEIGETGLLTC